MTGFEVAVLCLALNVYKESNGETERGQMAVALVTLNRARDHGDVCKTVMEPHQFSWTKRDIKNGVLRLGAHPDRNGRAWGKAYDIAVQSFTTHDFTKGATHFHNLSVNPGWASRMQWVGTWGNHKFYKER